MDEKPNVIEKLKSGGITAKKMRVEYKVSDQDKNFIRAIFNIDGRLTVKPSNAENFIFKDSNKDLVYKIARLIMEATKIEDK